MFSSRVPGDLEPNRLTRAVRRARAEGRALLDLTISNPTAAGIAYPDDILAPLADAAARVYEPDARGLRRAREAVAGDYARRGIAVATERLVLTASTSEAYSLLFKLLCAPQGNAVLVPAPSYPLFDHLTQLDGVDSVPYRLEYHGRWALDRHSIDEAFQLWGTPSGGPDGGRIRAVLAVSPNNPTGSVLSAAELAFLASRCAERNAALIVDEVFADYPLSADRCPLSDLGARCLTFRLGGLSKSAGLPQVKLGWIVVGGPDALADAALERLELVSDTYLSVSTPVQVAAPALIARGARVRAAILERVRGNHRELRRAAAGEPSVQVLEADAGWSAVLRVPATRSEEQLSLDLLERDGVLVHPGFFFDFPHEAFLVVSLLPEPATFAEGVRRILERVRE